MALIRRNNPLAHTYGQGQGHGTATILKQPTDKDPLELSIAATKLKAEQRQKKLDERNAKEEENNQRLEDLLGTDLKYAPQDAEHITGLFNTLIEDATGRGVKNDNAWDVDDPDYLKTMSDLRNLQAVAKQSLGTTATYKQLLDIIKSPGGLKTYNFDKAFDQLNEWRDLPINARFSDDGLNLLDLPLRDRQYDIQGDGVKLATQLDKRGGWSAEHDVPEAELGGIRQGYMDQEDDILEPYYDKYEKWYEANQGHPGVPSFGGAGDKYATPREYVYDQLKGHFDPYYNARSTAGSSKNQLAQGKHQLAKDKLALQERIQEWKENTKESVSTNTVNPSTGKNYTQAEVDAQETISNFKLFDNGVRNGNDLYIKELMQNRKLAGEDIVSADFSGLSGEGVLTVTTDKGTVKEFDLSDDAVTAELYGMYVSNKTPGKQPDYSMVEKLPSPPPEVLGVQQQFPDDKKVSETISSIFASKRTGAKLSPDIIKKLDPKFDYKLENNKWYNYEGKKKKLVITHKMGSPEFAKDPTWEEEIQLKDGKLSEKDFNRLKKYVDPKQHHTKVAPEQAQPTPPAPTPPAPTPPAPPPPAPPPPAPPKATPAPSAGLKGTPHPKAWTKLPSANYSIPGYDDEKVTKGVSDYMNAKGIDDPEKAYGDIIRKWAVQQPGKYEVLGYPKEAVVDKVADYAKENNMSFDQAWPVIRDKLEAANKAVQDKAKNKTGANTEMTPEIENKLDMAVDSLKSRGRTLKNWSYFGKENKEILLTFRDNKGDTTPIAVPLYDATAIDRLLKFLETGDETVLD